MEFSNLARIVYKRTYARKDDGKLENWKETVRRSVIGNTRNRNVSDNEINRLFYFADNRKSGFAGRGWWFSGAPAHAKLGGAALSNCWFLTSDDWMNFVLAQDLLMLGGGVGLSVQHKYASKLPKIKSGVIIQHKLTKDADLIVPDSREGWCELTRRVLESFFITGKGFTYSTICLRAYGEPIAGFGGVASGSRPLVSFIEKLCAILINREGKKPRPIDAGDILTSIGEMVVSGNVRRSAIILIGDPHDKDYLQAKRWDLGQIPSYRSCANYSVAADDIDDLHPLFWKTYEHGEPFGIVNLENIQKYARMGELKIDTATGVNPCLRGDTLITTDKGLITIQEIVENGPEKYQVQTYNTATQELEWDKITEGFLSRENTDVIKLEFNYGGKIILTPDHRVFTENRGYIEASKLTVEDRLFHYFWGIFAKIKKITVEQNCDVYDINTERNHNFFANGILVHNCAEATLEDGEPCNLVEQALCNMDSQSEFEESSRLWFRAAKRVTLENYHHPKINEVIKRNRRVGVGITGILNSKFYSPEALDGAYLAIQNEDTRYSEELGVPKSIRTTVVKPSGTMSKVFDCDGYEGAHVAYSRYIIQRIRFASNDLLIPKLKSAGHNIEPVQRIDGTLDHGTQVVDFYIKAPDGYPVADEDWSTWKQLDVLKTLQKHWADQSVSITVYYKREDIPLIKEWLKENLSQIKTISFLCHNDHGFKQAPKEAITEAQYVKFSARIKPINDDDITEGDLESQECAGGICPVK